jgi:hypothetical protein
MVQYLTLARRIFGTVSTRRAAGTLGTRQYGTVKIYISSMSKLTIFTRVFLIDGHGRSTRYTEYRYLPWYLVPYVSHLPSPYD